MNIVSKLPFYKDHPILVSAAFYMVIFIVIISILNMMTPSVPDDSAYAPSPEMSRRLDTKTP